MEEASGRELVGQESPRSRDGLWVYFEDTQKFNQISD